MSSAVSANPLDAKAVVRLVKCAARIAYGGDVEEEESAACAVKLVCTFTGWPLGHIYLLDRERQVLVSTNIWHISDPERFAPFVEATQRTPMPMGVGLPGRVAASARPAWIPDLAHDGNFQRAAAASQVGIAAAVGFPIVSSAGVEGVMEFFAAERCEPDDSLFDLLSYVGLELGSAFDRARARSALAASETRLASAERLGHLGAWLYHVDHDVLEWSAELCALYGLDPATTPTTFGEYLSRVHPDDLDRVRAAIMTTLETGGVFEHEYRLVFRPPEVRWAHSRGEVTRAPDGKLLLSGYCQDITERKVKEEAILLGQERLAEAQRLAHLGSWNWDVATNAVAWSDELFRIYGLGPGSSPATFEAYLGHLHPGDLDRVQRAVARAAANGEPFEHEYRIVRPGGEQRWVHARGEVVERIGGATGRLAGYCQDITERRAADEERERLEGQLRQSQRLESLGQLAGGVAHDFNNLLAVILSHATFVDEELAEVLHSSAQPRVVQAQADVKQMALAASRAAELTRQLLAFSRREVVRPRILDLNGVVRGVKLLLRRTIGEHVELRTALAPDLAPVCADPGQLEQVLVNLAVNARDAMPTGGRITIETDHIDLDASAALYWRVLRPGRHVRLQVTDTGHGMSREVAERAFEPFFTTKPTGQGTGLGLSTVFGIVAQTGGSARISSEPGRGTTVIALFPASDGAPSLPEAVAPAPRRRGQGELLLVVEDEEAMRDVTRRMLERNGYRVIAASGGAEAIELTRQTAPEVRLLLTDVVMPGMAGVEVAAAIEALVPGIPVVYMSGYASSVLGAQGSLEPGIVLVEKPFSEDQLLAVVQELLP